MHTRLLLTLSLFLAGPVLAETTFTVDPDAGNNAFTAVFDSAIGERITAVSNAVACTLTADEEALSGKATCSVALTAIRVDNDDTKSDHFRQWATNKKVDPEKCSFELTIPGIKVTAKPEAMKPTEFDTKGTFTICGRHRDDKGSEHVKGSIIYLPPESYGENEAPILRIRAKIEAFDRERYGISPAATAGWLARVQQLAPVVAKDGTIEVNLFAYQQGEKR